MNLIAKKPISRFSLSVITLLILGLGFIPTTFAQKLKFGPRVGVSSAGVELDDLIIKDANDVEQLKLTLQNSTPEYQFGAFARVQLLGAYVQPELLFTTSASTYQVEDATTGDISDRTERFYNVEIPVIAGLKLGPLRAQAGPVFRTQLGNKSDLVDVDNYIRKFKESSVGVQAGIGIDLGKKIVLDVKYEPNLGRFRDEITILGTTYPMSDRKSQLIFAAGYSF
ncbi:MAG: porin family protein [Bacteroidia bacterium]|nr:porin family protein [Bacteroidia bacterium]